jgi:LmbE family N-acetylglucosaminyl deacetylase
MATLGGHPPEMLGFPDGGLADHAAALKERLVRAFRRLGVDRLVTFDPWKRYEIHPDHVTVGRMASEAAAFACFPRLYPEHLAEGLLPRQPREIWYMMPTDHRPNRVVDIARTFDRKVASLLCHASQLEMLAPWFSPAGAQASPEELREGARFFLAGMAGALAGLAPKLELVEAFYAVPVGPGHLDIFQEMFAEAAGAPPGPVEVV